MDSFIAHIVGIHGTGTESVIPLLQSIQKEYHYLPQHLLLDVCEATGITPTQLMGVASFYQQFRFKPAGKHRIKVCVGTACHVKGASLVFDALKRKMNLKEDEDTDLDGTFTLEKVSCLGCCSLAPAVQIDHITYGHVTPITASEILSDFLQKQNEPKETHNGLPQPTQTNGEIRIGLGSCCVASGSDAILQSLEETVRTSAYNLTIKHVGCVGMCHQVPLIEVIENNSEPSLYAKVNPDDIRYIVEKHFKPTGSFRQFKDKVFRWAESVQHDDRWDGIDKYGIHLHDAPVAAFLNEQIPIATEHRGVLQPSDLQEYIRLGGFAGFYRAMEMTGEAIVNEIILSGIRGRGGGGFPTGLKWQAVAKESSERKYLICNGDEGDPGAFMDRMLLESYPFRIIEGMLIAARATGATHGYFYIRAEYPLAVLRIREALDICRKNGLLGNNIFNRNFHFNITIKEGAGAFVCGEETALIASIEGKRGFPVIRPPYPSECGLWGFPTLINNTETFAQIPYILSRGYQSFAAIGTDGSKGTKVFALAGKINRGGLIEVPMGISLNHIVETIGGGVQNNKKLKAVQIGGPSGGCIPHFLAHKPIDFESLEEAGAMMGSGGLVVLDETDCMVDIARYFLSFTQNESCGKCTFCRTGTRRMLDIMNKLCAGTAQHSDLDALENLARWTKRGSLCGLGKTAPNPILSTLRYFRSEYEAHLNGYCPAGKCTSLIHYQISSQCIGCTICAQSCPVDAIPFSPHQTHTIQTQLCTKCDICRLACPVNAIYVTSQNTTPTA